MIEDIDDLLSVGVLLEDEIVGDDVYNFTIQELKDKLDEIQAGYPDNEIRIELGYGQYSDGSLYPRIGFMRLENNEEKAERLRLERKYREYGYEKRIRSE